MKKLDFVPGTNLKILQNRLNFSFGIDAILLSSFTKAYRDDIVFDLGTGTGIIPLRLYGLYKPKKIIGLEIQKEVADLAKEAVKINKLEEKIQIDNIDLNLIANYYKKAWVDVVTSNPPYIKVGSGIVNSTDNFAISRHEIKAKLEDIFSNSSYLLQSKGRLYIVHRPNRLVDLISLGRKYKLEPKRIQFVHSKPNTSPKLILIEFLKDGNPDLKIEKPLIVYNDKGAYNQEILDIYGEIKES